MMSIRDMCEAAFPDIITQVCDWYAISPNKILRAQTLAIFFIQYRFLEKAIPGQSGNYYFSLIYDRSSEELKNINSAYYYRLYCAQLKLGRDEHFKKVVNSVLEKIIKKYTTTND